MSEMGYELEKILGPKVQNEINEAKKELQKENMTAFLMRVSLMTHHIEFHIIKNCTFGSPETIAECIKKAGDVRTRSLNKLGEMLVEKCGGKMIYLKE